MAFLIISHITGSKDFYGCSPYSRPKTIAPADSFIALVLRGGDNCYFTNKVARAIGAGASGI